MALDAEALYACMAAGQWSGALELVFRNRVESPDRVTRHALELLASEVGRRLSDPGLSDDDVERLLLLGRAGRIPVSRDQEARLVESLLDRYRSDPERALSVARFRPDLSAAISVLRQYGEPDSTSRSSDDGPLRVTTAHPGTHAVDAGRSLFRSASERVFFDAAVRVFDEMLVQANVALHAALDFERLRARLTSAERTYFFQALIDFVVFDPADDYRPAWFFELDSGIHDDAVRGERDRLKDRIVSLAGHRLVRMRPAGPGAATVDEVERLLRDLEAEPAVYIDSLKS